MEGFAKKVGAADARTEPVTPGHATDRGVDFARLADANDAYFSEQGESPVSLDEVG